MNRVEMQWLKTTLGEASFAEIEQIPYPTLILLYPHIFQYGPNGDAVVDFMKDARSAVEAHADLDAYSNYAQAIRIAMHEGSEIPYFHMNDNPHFKIGTDVEKNLRLLVKEWIDDSPSIPHIFEAATYSLLSLIAYQGLMKDMRLWSNYEASYCGVVESFGLNPDKYRWRS